MKFKLLCLKNSLMLFFLLFTTIVAFSKTLEHPIPKTSNVNLHKTKAFSIITSAQTGDWSATSTWFGGVVPTSTDDVVIASGHIVTMNDDAYATRNSGTTTTVDGTLATIKTYLNNGTTTINGSFRLDDGGWVSDASGTNSLVYGSNGTLIFNSSSSYLANNGNYWPTSNGPVNVTVNSGGLNLGFARTVNGLFQIAAPITLTAVLTLSGTCQINGSGYFNNTPNYGNGSTLIYNTTFTVDKEWTGNGAAGTGIPANITLQAGTLSFPNSDRGIPGNLIINSGSTLSLNNSSGDLYLGGNWDNSGSFNPNGRGVFFNRASGIQTISKSGGETFNYLIKNGTSSLKFANNVIVNGSSGDVLQLLNGGIDLNGQTLTLSGSGGNVKLSGARAFSSTIPGGIFNISGVYPNVKNIYGGTLSIPTTVTTVLLNGLDFGSNVTTVSGKLTIGSTGYVPTNPPVYGASSTLEYNGTSGYNVGNEWNGNATIAGNGVPKNVSLISSTISLPNSDRGLAGNLTIDSNSTLNLNGSSGDLYIAGNWINNKTFNANNRAVFFNGNSAQTITGATTFDYFTVNNTATTPSVTLQASSSIIINKTLNFLNGKLIIGVNNLIIGNTGTIDNSGTGKYVVTNSTGQLKRTVGSSDVLFAVGNASYNPITFNNTGGTADVYGVRVVDGAIPAIINNNKKTINRRWLVSEDVAGGSDLKVVAQYNGGEENTDFGTSTDPKIGLFNGTCWTEVLATQSGSNPYIFTSNSNFKPTSFTGTQYFALGKDNSFSAPLSITKQPVTPAGYVCEDGPLTLTVVATGSTNLSYEWKKDGVAIPGAPNSATYYIAHTTLATAGTYSVIVYDNCSRTITSNDAVITIDPIPTMAKPVSTTICGAGGKSFITFSGLIPGITGQFLYSTSVTPSNVLSEIGTADVNGEYKFETTFIPPSYNRATVTIIQGINTISGCSKFFTIPDNQFIIDIGKVAVWNGSTWTNSGPSIYNAAYFGAAYSKSVDITTCAVIVDGSAVVTIPAGKTLTVTEGITVTSGSLTIKSDANLIQINKDAVNTGNINVERTVTGLRYQPGTHVDYVYWSSPVANQKTKNTVGLFDGFSPYTPNDRFYTYRESNDRFYETGDPTFVPGKGYAVQAETNKGTSYNKDYKFTGKPNNGDISYNITKVGGGYNLVGNPYPSNINFEELYQNNITIIENTAWFWTNNVFVASQQGSGYGGNNYAVWNGSGGVSATSTPSGSPTPTGIIKVGQGFIVQKKNTGTSALQFKNSYSAGHDLRVSSTAPFFQKGVSEKNRFTLQLLSPSQLINSQLIAYVVGATNDYEQDYDAEAFDNSSDLFYSILPGKKLVIQGKSAAFTIEDKVLLGANFFQAGSYTISLDNMEGIFNGVQNVYLKDKQEGIITNLSQAAYTFNATKGDNSGRFEIIYKPESVLATNVTTKEELMVYEDSGDFVVKAQTKKITDLQVFDMNGRLVMNLKPNSTKAVIPSNTLIRGVYVLKISQDGIVTSKKIVK